MNSIWTDFARLIFHVEVTIRGSERRASGGAADRRPSPASSSATGGGRVSYSGGNAGVAGAGAMAMAAAAGGGVQGYGPEL